MSTRTNTEKHKPRQIAKSSRDNSTIAEPSALAIRPREAARVLGISERLLWSLTNRGEIPHLKLGRATLYPVEQLQEWLRERAEKGLRR